MSGGNVAVTLAALTGVMLLPSPVNVDLVPPVASITTTPSANGNGWINTSPVTVNLSATDSGSGVEQLRYWINNGPVTVAAGSSASTQISGAGTNSVGLRALDNAGNISALASLAVNIDLTPPLVSDFSQPLDRSGRPMAGWYRLQCRAAITDNLSGVDPNSGAFAAVDEYGTVQPNGPVSVGSGGSYSFTVMLPASRNGNDQDGRHYKITVSAKDLAGNVGSAATIVTVPHDQGH